MTAGSGIIHQEMPKGDTAGPDARVSALGESPSSLKMTPPRYQEVKAADIPEVTDDDGTQVRVDLRKLLGQERAGGRNRRRPRLP